jgi:hypothetical protein
VCTYLAKREAEEGKSAFQFLDLGDRYGQDLVDGVTPVGYSPPLDIRPLDIRPWISAPGYPPLDIRAIRQTEKGWTLNIL